MKIKIAEIIRTVYQKDFISIPPSIRVFETSSGTIRNIAYARVNANTYTIRIWII